MLSVNCKLNFKLGKVRAVLGLIQRPKNKYISFLIEKEKKRRAEILKNLNKYNMMQFIMRLKMLKYFYFQYIYESDGTGLDLALFYMCKNKVIKKIKKMQKMNITNLKLFLNMRQYCILFKESEFYNHKNVSKETIDS